MNKILKLTLKIAENLLIFLTKNETKIKKSLCFYRSLKYSALKFCKILTIDLFTAVSSDFQKSDNPKFLDRSLGADMTLTTDRGVGITEMITKR